MIERSRDERRGMSTGYILGMLTACIVISIKFIPHPPEYVSDGTIPLAATFLFTVGLMVKHILTGGIFE